MKTRIIIAVIFIPLLLAVILFAPVWALGIVTGAIAGVSAWELLRCTEMEASLRIKLYCSAAAFLLPFLSSLFPGASVCEIVLFALFALLFIELMLSYEKEGGMSLDTVTMGLLAGFILPLLLSGLVRLGLRENGKVYALLPFVAAFCCDSGAYFIGCAIGKHKFAPRLSPHKSLEGCAGGFICAIAGMLIYGLVLTAFKFEVNFAVMGVYGFLGAVACQLGDLSFSAIKRLCGIKDYGNLIPGHGGMLDRFDSMFWTAAMVELLVRWVPAIG